MKTRYVIKIFGKVQGVFFRAQTKEKAEELGITGFARNEPDGSIFIEAEGKEKAIKKFIKWCKKGPAAARVEKITLERNLPKGYKTFEIRN